MSSTIQIVTAGSIGACLEYLPSTGEGHDITILPSSLRRNDRAAMELREHLRQQGRSTHLRVPGGPIPSLLGRTAGGWTRVPLPDSSGMTGVTISLPTQLMEAGEVWSMVDIDAISGRGPYVLDLLGRHAGTPTRVRLLGSRHRAELAISILQARPLQRHVIVRHFPSFELLATTADPIAAELLALALVDEDITRDHQVAGPWEDELVQRATERDLGSRLPDEITVDIVGLRGALIDAALGRILGRIGVDLPGH